MTTVKGLRERLDRLIEVAGSQNALARAAGVSSAAISNWRHDAIPFQSTLTDVAGKLGVSLAWLSEGKGDPEAEIEKFRSRLRVPGPVVQKARMIAEAPDHEEDPGRGDEHTAAHLSLETLTRIIREIRLNKKVSAEERWRMVQPYQEELERRLANKP